MIPILVSMRAGYCLVTAPHHPEFLDFVRAVGATWNRVLGQFVFSATQVIAVERKLVEIFGTDGAPLRPEDMITLEIRIPPDVTLVGEQDAIWIAGREIARCQGDVTLGQGVRFLSGAPTGVGGVKWKTLVEGAAVIRLDHLPRLAVLGLAEMYAAEIVAEEMTGVAAEPETLAQERDRLRQRVAEIEVMMAVRQTS